MRFPYEEAARNCSSPSCRKTNYLSLDRQQRLGGIFVAQAKGARREPEVPHRGAAVLEPLQPRGWERRPPFPANPTGVGTGFPKAPFVRSSGSRTFCPGTDFLRRHLAEAMSWPEVTSSNRKCRPCDVIKHHSRHSQETLLAESKMRTTYCRGKALNRERFFQASLDHSTHTGNLARVQPPFSKLFREKACLSVSEL